MNSSSQSPSLGTVIDFILLCTLWRKTRALTTVDSSFYDRENCPLFFPLRITLILLLFYPCRSGIMKFWRIDDGPKEKRKEKKIKIYMRDKFNLILVLKDVHSAVAERWRGGVAESIGRIFCSVNRLEKCRCLLAGHKPTREFTTSYGLLNISLCTK